MSNKIKHFYDFGKFRFSPKEKCLWRDGELLTLSPKSLEVLNLLLEGNSDIVSREKILENVWADTFIEEANLTVAISNLRKTLGQNGTEKFIQTVPKKGYRFVADVKKVREEERVDEFESTLKSIPTDEPIKTKKPKVRWHFVAIILLGVFLLASFSLWLQYKSETELSSIPTNKRNIKSIAVLPLKNLSEDQKGQIFSLGLTDNLISRLGKLNRFAVRPLSAVDEFAKSDKGAIEFGKELKVDAVIVGTIQTVDDRLRLNITLLDVRDGAQIWSNSFDEMESDFFKLQDKLSVQVADNLVAKLSIEDNKKLTKNETKSQDAFQAYSKGRFFLAKRTEEGIKKAIALFEKATELDQNYISAYVGQATGYFLLSDSAFSYSEPLEHSEKLSQLIDKILVLDSNSADGYALKGSFEQSINWNLKAASQSFEKSIRINPNSAQAHHWFAWTLLAQKRFEEAEKEMNLAYQLDPTSRIIAAERGLPFIYTGRYEEAIPYGRQAVELDGDFFQSRFRLHQALFLSEKYDEANEQLEAMKNLSSEDNPIYQILNGMTLAKTGEKKEAEKVYKKLVARSKSGEYISPIFISVLAAGLGDDDGALDWLEVAYREHNDYMHYLELEPVFQSLHDNERFKNLVERVRKSEH